MTKLTTRDERFTALGAAVARALDAGEVQAIDAGRVITQPAVGVARSRDCRRFRTTHHAADPQPGCKHETRS